MDTCIWYLKVSSKNLDHAFLISKSMGLGSCKTDIPDGWIKVYVPKQQNQILGLGNTVYMYVRQHVQKYNLPH